MTTGSRLFFSICLGFLCGIAARSFAPAGIFSILCVAAVAAFCGAYGFLARESRDAAIAAGTFLLFLALGALRMQCGALPHDPVLLSHLNRSVTLDGMIAAEPDLRDAGTFLTIRVVDLQEGSSTVPVGAKVLAKVPPHALVAYGDRVRMRGTLSLPRSFAGDSGTAFDYPGYLASQGITFQLQNASVVSAGSSGSNPFLRLVFAFKARYESGLDAVLPEPESGLAAGITIGDKRGIGARLSQDFQATGLLQIVVLSGYNVTVVMQVFSKLLPKVRAIRLSSAIAVVAFFMAVAGGGASAARACVMALIALYARDVGRRFDPLRGLLLAAALMSLWNPYVLAYDPGFQLSAISLLGLIWFAEPLERRLSFLPKRFQLREIVAATVAAQIAVAPYLLHAEGALPLYSLLANALATLPLPAAMLCAFCAAIVGMIFGGGATPLALPAYLVLHYVVGVGEFFAGLPHASVEVGALPFGETAIAYAFLGLFGTLLQRKTASEREAVS